MAEQPALHRIHVIGYSANDRDFPIVALVADPRVAGYRVPEDLSACPDKRYPNHVFTGAQPLSGDERVRHVWEILPSPTVPFTRYDDDLGPVQGNRRSVKNEGQVASLAADKRVTYEAREGSAIVYTELEESWSVATDEDGNSLFPFKDRDFYDPSRGPVQERRQLFTPTGDEVGSLENVNGVITQTSYEPYNEFLSVKVVQTYKVDGPQLIGRATDNDGQLITVTTQRKGADSYIPPNPTATRTVEVNREDAESLVERIVDTPEVFKANTFSVERPDPIPQKFRVAVPIQSSQEIVEGSVEVPILEEGEISKSEEQRNKFIKRVSSTSRDQAVLPQTLTGKSTNNERQEVVVTETLQLGNTNETPTATTTVESEALGDGNYVITKTQVDEVFSAITLSKERPDPVPPKFRAAIPSLTRQENLEGEAQEPTLVTGEIVKSEQQVNQFVKRISTTSRDETNLPQSLTQKTTTNEGLLATVSETLQSGDTTVTPTATKSIQSEALGDGTYVVTVTDLPKVFAGETFSVERPDPLPQKFRVAARTLTSQQTIEGTVNPNLDLISGQISKSEQQVTEFLKRESVTSRDETQLPVTLVQRATDNERQLVTVTESLQNADSIELPSATATIQSEALGDGNFLVTKSEVPEVFGAETFRKTKEDLTPQKFRAAQEDTTFEETVEGVADPNISLATGEFAKSEQQVNKFVKRVATTSRVITEAVTLLERVLTNEGQIGTRTLRLQAGDQTFTPSATMVDASVEALGDGRTVKIEVVVPNVFAGRSIVKTKVDLTPEKFRAAQQDTTNEESVAGAIDPSISLGTGEFRKSEQQVTEFVKRVSTTNRDISASTDLTETVITPQGQVATRTLRLSAEAQSIIPDALLVDGSIEALGDGRTVKTEVKVGEVFDSLTKSAQKPDTIPEKFRVNSPIKRTEETIEQDDAEDPELGLNEYLKTEQRLTEFTIQKTTVEREDTFNETNNQRLEENWGIQIPYREYISDEIPSGDNYEAEGLDDKNHLVREYDKDNLDLTLSSFSVTIPSSIDLDLPRVLKSVTVNWEEAQSSTNNESENPPISGAFTNITQQDGGRISSTLSLSPSVNVEFEDVWGKNLPSTIHLFFLKKEDLTTAQIALKVGAVDSWPVFKPKSFYTTIFGKTETKTIEASVSRSIQINNTPQEYGYVPSKSFSEFSNIQLNPTSINIQPCLTSGISINEPATLTADELNIVIAYEQLFINLSYGTISLDAVEIDQPLNHTLNGNVNFSIPATSPEDIPRSGIYLISSSAEPYKFGWFLVRAISFNASILG